MNATVQAILQKLENLSEEKQKQVLNFIEQIDCLRGVSGSLLLKHAGKISPDELDRMESAIEEFEQVDLDEWNEHRDSFD